MLPQPAFERGHLVLKPDCRDNLHLSRCVLCISSCAADGRARALYVGSGPHRPGAKAMGIVSRPRAGGAVENAAQSGDEAAAAEEAAEVNEVK